MIDDDDGKRHTRRFLHTIPIVSVVSANRYLGSTVMESVTRAYILKLFKLEDHLVGNNRRFLPSLNFQRRILQIQHFNNFF